MVYLLHFDRPYKHAKHYLGFARDGRLDERIDEHYFATPGDGKHHRLMQVIRAAGISFSVVRTWTGGRQRERQLKRQGGASRLCPECKAARGVKVRTVRAGGV